MCLTKEYIQTALICYMLIIIFYGSLLWQCCCLYDNLSRNCWYILLFIFSITVLIKFYSITRVLKLVVELGLDLPDQYDVLCAYTKNFCIHRYYDS